jgi:DNA repair protein RadC
MNRVWILKESEGTIAGPQAVLDNLKPDHPWDQEHFSMLTLDQKHCLINAHCLFVGGLTECTVDPKIVWKRALLDGAAAVIFAHNHPTGNLEPSAEDHRIHSKLLDGGKILTIRVLDGIIYNEAGDYYAYGT